MCIHQKKQKSASLRSRPQSWQAEQRRIREEANRKRSEAAKEQPRTETGFAEKPGAGTECSRTTKHPERKAKAAASKTNKGAVARGDKLAKERATT